MNKCKLQRINKIFLISLLMFLLIFLVSCISDNKVTEDSDNKNFVQSETIEQGANVLNERNLKKEKNLRDKKDINDSNNKLDLKDGLDSSKVNINTSNIQKNKKTKKTEQNSSQKQTQASVSDKTLAQTKIETVSLSISWPGGEGVILGASDVKYENNDTVLDCLLKITREKKIHMEYSGVRGAAYIEGINNIYEFDHGPESGWIYSVNGVSPSQSVGSYKVKAGDRIELIYTTDLGKNLNR